MTSEEIRKEIDALAITAASAWLVKDIDEFQFVYSTLEDCLTLWDMSNNLNYEIIREKIQETLKDLGDIYPELTQRLTDLLAAMPEREAE
jgi:hypothetical protein